MMNPESSGLRVKYGGELNEIDINTFLSSLSSISVAIDEINNEVGKGQKLEVRIKALDRGSFFIDIGLIAIPVLDSIARTVDLATVVKILVDLLNLRKFLKGEKPQKAQEKGDNVVVTSASESQFTINKQTFNMYNSNVSIGSAIERNFEALTSDSSIDSFEIQDRKQKPLFKVEREDFERMSKKIVNEVDEKGTRVVPETSTLLIVKVVFEKSRKWDFVRYGRTISAVISDESFFAKVDHGEGFAKGDSLKAKLEVTQVFDEDMNVFIDHSFVVTRVLKHIRRPEQGSLNLQT